ncbi:MAG: hypothetical protein GIW99_07490 [Candidatus Eremiobacteraeota bacterium]|nr:hypothetical protein [Candidatus Eremiobacteraeota bacterium]MBC5827506.1 hypothetical protein [Candidatus Eremiobacteraeota bacterium]
MKVLIKTGTAFALCSFALSSLFAVASASPVPGWRGYARDAHHAAGAPAASQPINAIHWRTPVDLNPQYAGAELLAHYGSPVITASNTIVVPVKTGATDGFRVEARKAATGSLVWSFASDYTLPPHDWTPSFNPSLTYQNRLYFPGAGGKLFYRDNPDTAQQTVRAAVFYGLKNYLAAKTVYDGAVRINTPVTTDSQGNVFFGFVVLGSTPLNLQSGLARIGADGRGSWISASSAASDGAVTQVGMNCAPAVSWDLKTVYVAVTGNSTGYLVALDASTLQTKSEVVLKDPASGNLAHISGDSTASPTIGSDGDVYYGVLESSFGAHNDRGWLLHFDSTLAHAKIPGSFGWDDTASLVPTRMVPSYGGGSPYLLMTKYNNYAGIGTGDGQNKIAILDPDATEADPISGIPVMKEVITKLGITPDAGHPGGVREWCINTAVVDRFTSAVLANSEDGYLYRWNTAANTFSQRIQLTSGVAESYTPTLIGPDGQVYAINNAVLFAIGR